MSIAPASLSRALRDVFADFLLVAGPDVQIFGPSDNAANSAPPGIWWEPGKEGWAPGQRLGGPGAPSALWTREASVVFLIFGGPPDEEYSAEEAPLHEGDKTEFLLSAFVNAFQRRLSQHGCRVVDGEWMNGGREGLGLAYQLTVAIRLPLVREDTGTVRLNAVTHTEEFANE